MRRTKSSATAQKIRLPLWRCVSSRRPARPVATMQLIERLRLILVACFLAASLAVVGIATSPFAATPFQGLVGAWSGSGKIRYEDGQPESIRCTAYYSEADRSLRLAIRCRGATNDVEIRGLLALQGDQLSGTWEERTFNVSGEARGRTSRGRMSLSITGGIVSGSMSVTYGGSRQTVLISVQGVALKSVNVTLTRS
jgi:hypothetical protein